MSRSGEAEGGAAHYLVTGGAGFIGSHLVEALAAAGHRVRVLDNFSSGSRENLAALAGEIEVIEGDVRDGEVCRRSCEGVDYVLHEAALVSVAESLENPIATHEVNALGTLKLLRAAQEAGCRRVVYAASASAYGDTEVLPHEEGMKPRPMSPYAVAKHVGELYCRVFHELYGLETVALRYFNVFGPRQDPSSPYSGVIARFILQLVRGEGLKIFGDGEQLRDFVPVENVVEACLLACTSARAAGEVINVGCGEATTVNRLVEMLGEIVGSPCEVTYGPPREGDIRYSVADIGRARELLGYQVQVSVEEGLRSTVGWYRAAGEESGA